MKEKQLSTVDVASIASATTLFDQENSLFVILLERGWSFSNLTSIHFCSFRANKVIEAKRRKTMLEIVKIETPLEYTPCVYVYKRSHHWYWKFKLPNGRWFYGRAPGNSEQIVKRNARKKELQLAKGMFTTKEFSKIQQGKSSECITLEKAIDEYIEHLKLEGASPHYSKWESERLASCLAFFKNQRSIKYIHKVTEEEAHRFRTYLLEKVRDRHIKRISAFGMLNSTKRFFKWLKKRKKISHNPWLEIEAISVPKEERSRLVAPSPDIIARPLSAQYTHKQGFPIKEFAYGLFRTGARKEELLFLEVDDVDWETGYWVISPKECPTKYGLRWSPKNGKRRETVIPRDVLKMLRPLVQRAIENRVVGYTPNQQNEMVPCKAKFIFTVRDGKLSNKRQTVYRRVDCIYRAWRSLFIAANLATQKSPFTPHDMRRGFNLVAKDAGISLEDRALILGHDKKVNENHYCGRAKVNIEEISRILNSNF